jgi:hypothetical protein
MSNILEEFFEIFNEIQTGSNTKENLEKMLSIVEKKKMKNLIDNLEQVFLIIIKNYEKNNIPLKNIKDFLKQFLAKLIKNEKKLPLAKDLISHFCSFFTQNTKKSKYRSVNIYFLRKFFLKLELFLSPFSNEYEALYDDNTRHTIKSFILSSLRSKQSNVQMSVLKIRKISLIFSSEEHSSTKRG